MSGLICIELVHPKNLNKEPLHIEISCIHEFKELVRDYNSLAMAPRRFLDERKLVLHMHERGDSYSEVDLEAQGSISTVSKGHFRFCPKNQS